MRPVSPPGMPKTNSMPASSSTRTSAWGTSISAGVTGLASRNGGASVAVRKDAIAEALDRLHDLLVGWAAGMRVAQAEEEIVGARRLAPPLELAHARLGVAQDQTIGGEVLERELGARRNVLELCEPVLPVVPVGGHHL